VLLKAEELLAKLQEAEKNGEKDLDSLWRPEYASYMVEGTPGKVIYPMISLLTFTFEQ
jgi:glutamate--cysteine ligase catalytic subunit